MIAKMNSKVDSAARLLAMYMDAYADKILPQAAERDVVLMCFLNNYRTTKAVLDAAIRESKEMTNDA